MYLAQYSSDTRNLDNLTYPDLTQPNKVVRSCVLNALNQLHWDRLRQLFTVKEFLRYHGLHVIMVLNFN